MDWNHCMPPDRDLHGGVAVRIEHVGGGKNEHRLPSERAAGKTRENRGTPLATVVYPKTGAHRHSAGAPGGTMIRIRWAVFAIALGCLLSVGRPVAASASISAGATSQSAQGLRAANV